MDTEINLAADNGADAGAAAGIDGEPAGSVYLVVMSSENNRP